MACEPGMTVTAALMAIQSDPVTADGLSTSPVVWEQNCLEEVCGSCAMLINGKVRQACSAIIDDLDQPIVLEPMSKFPVVRDLRVDRSAMFESLARVRAWNAIDGLHQAGNYSAGEVCERNWLVALSSCIMCGNCLEACPQINDRSPFVGAFIVAHVLRFNGIARDRMLARERLEAMKGPGGIAECANAQTCEDACPKGIPLNTAIARAQWEVLKSSLRNFFKG